MLLIFLSTFPCHQCYWKILQIEIAKQIRIDIPSSYPYDVSRYLVPKNKIDDVVVEEKENTIVYSLTSHHQDKYREKKRRQQEEEKKNLDPLQTVHKLLSDLCRARCVDMIVNVCSYRHHRSQCREQM